MQDNDTDTDLYGEDMDASFDDDCDVFDVIPDNPFDMNGNLASLFEEDRIVNGDEDDDASDVVEKTGRDDVPAINEGDFVDPEQQFLFINLKKHARAACNVNSKPKARDAALEWIFTPNLEDALRLDFNTSCRALGARPMVVRARAAHQLWRAGILLSGPLSILSERPPDSIMSDIAAVVGPNLPEKIARETWHWPSIPAEALREKFANVSGQAYHAAVDALVAEGYLAITQGRLYFISRNPGLLSKTGRDRFSFSGSLYGE